MFAHCLDRSVGRGVGGWVGGPTPRRPVRRSSYSTTVLLQRVQRSLFRHFHFRDVQLVEKETQRIKLLTGDKEDRGTSEASARQAQIGATSGHGTVYIASELSELKVQP